MKKLYLIIFYLLPAIVSADWLFTAGCGATVQSTCLESMNTCNYNGTVTYSITSSELVYLDDSGYQVNTNTGSLTPAWANIIYDVSAIDPYSGPYTQYDQHGQCGWSGPNCAVDAPYDPVTEACSTSTPPPPPMLPKMFGNPPSCPNSQVGGN